MDGGGRSKASSPPQLNKPCMFAVYQNPTLSAALTANSLKPSKATFLLFFSLSSASALALLCILSRGSGLMETMRFKLVPEGAAYAFAKAIQTVVGIVFIGSVFALLRVLSSRRARNSTGGQISSSSEANGQSSLSSRQLGLMGIKPNVKPVMSESAKKPPKSKPSPCAHDALVPIHPPITSSNPKSRVGSDKSSVGSASKMSSFSTPSRSQSSPTSLYLVPGSSSPLPFTQTSPGMDSSVSTPWSGTRGFSSKEIRTEEQLEQFLAEVDEKIIESSGKYATPPPSIRGLGGMASPNTVTSPVNTPGTTRSTPLRPVRMSPGSQKFTTPPKKGEGEFPSAMSVEEAIEAFKNLGVYPQIEHWRDHLRQWFSSILLNPLLNKIETSHVQVMQTAAKLGVSITVSQIGSDSSSCGNPSTLSVVDRNEWQPALTLNEHGLLNQLRASLVQALDASTSNMPRANIYQSVQQNPMTPIMQECMDAITEHQRLQTLMKGEWAKGLLPHSNVREDSTVQRIRELAEGSCVKNYEYAGKELPTDSHLLLYLFCAFLEHPKWMLHVDSASYAGAQSSKNPLFLGALPPNERFPDKYISVIAGVPSTVHAGASILVVGKQSPPIFALYWDKKLQFSLQGRTALWDSILLLCYRIKVAYGGIVRGMHLGSSALSILPVLESENED